MSDIVFARTGIINPNHSVPGLLTIGNRSWPTIERGSAYTFVRKGEYTLKMDWKVTHTNIHCLRFDHDGIRTHLIHRALNDKYSNLEGCIAPGQSASEEGIAGSEAAMEEVFEALGKFIQGVKKTITVTNNIIGDETGADWMKRRKTAGKY